MVRPKIWSKVGKMLERETTLTSHPFMTLKTSQKKKGGEGAAFDKLQNTGQYGDHFQQYHLDQ